MAEERIKVSDGILHLKCGKEITIETIYEFKEQDHFLVSQPLLDGTMP